MEATTTNKFEIVKVNEVVNKSKTLQKDKST